MILSILIASTISFLGGMWLSHRFMDAYLDRQIEKIFPYEIRVTVIDLSKADEVPVILNKIETINVNPILN